MDVAHQWHKKGISDIVRTARVSSLINCSILVYLKYGVHIECCKNIGWCYMKARGSGAMTLCLVSFCWERALETHGFVSVSTVSLCLGISWSNVTYQIGIFWSNMELYPCSYDLSPLFLIKFLSAVFLTYAHQHPQFYQQPDVWYKLAKSAAPSTFQSGNHSPHHQREWQEERNAICSSCSVLKALSSHQHSSCRSDCRVCLVLGSALGTLVLPLLLFPLSQV